MKTKMNLVMLVGVAVAGLLSTTLSHSAAVPVALMDDINVSAVEVPLVDLADTALMEALGFEFVDDQSKAYVLEIREVSVGDFGWTQNHVQYVQSYTDSRYDSHSDSQQDQGITDIDTASDGLGAFSRRDYLSGLSDGALVLTVADIVDSVVYCSDVGASPKRQHNVLGGLSASLSVPT